MKIICQLRRKRMKEGRTGKEEQEGRESEGVSTYTAISVAGSSPGIVLTTFRMRDSFDFSNRLQWEVLSSFLMAVDQDPRDGRACPGSHDLWIIKAGPVRSKVRTNICALFELVSLAKGTCLSLRLVPKHTCVWVCEVNRREAGDHCRLQSIKISFLCFAPSRGCFKQLVPLGTSDCSLHTASSITFLFPSLL